MALHVPLQAKPLGSLRNCRAETVPAQSTAMAMAASEKFCMVFLMIGLTFNYKADECACAFRYFSTVAPGMGCNEQNGLPVSMGNMQRQPVRQGLLTPQLPPQVAEPFASLRNCRAETVPA
jgi:hypothetical protein